MSTTPSSLRRFVASSLRLGAPAILAVMLLPGPARAHETDQFTVPRGMRFADLGGELGGQVYATLERAVEHVNGEIRTAIESGRDPAHVRGLQSPQVLAKSVFNEFSSAFFLIENLENSLHYAPNLAQHPGRLRGYRETIRNIYQGAHFPLDPRQVFRLWHASTMKVHGTYMGPDKVGHFADMGYQYYLAYVRALAGGAAEDEAVAAAVNVGTRGLLFAEEGMVGYLSAGAYSNADLAANYVGFLFYRNLTDPQVLEGELRPALVERHGHVWQLARHVRRDGDFLDVFISDHFNEALNPSLFEPTMRPTMRSAIRNRADEILEWYADANGMRRPRAWFEDVERAHRTYWGGDYGHRGAPEDLVSISRTCFPEPPPPLDLEPHERSANGYTSLHWAAHTGDTAAIAALLDAGFPVDAPVRSRATANSEWGATPLHLAAAAGRDEAVALLVERGADVDAAAINGARALHRAIARPDVVARLLDAGARPDARDERGRAPLHWLAVAPRGESIDLLIAAGASVDARDNQGRTALHRAALAGECAVIARLLAAGADPGAAADMGVTPLHAAASGGSAHAAELLLAAGADSGAADEFGATPLHEAVLRGRRAVAAVLIGAGADPDARDVSGTRPLHVAARQGRERLAEALIAAGAGVNARNRMGATPLHEAVACGQAPMLHLLVAHGGDPSMRDDAGHTPLELARWERSRELAVLRLSAPTGSP